MRTLILAAIFSLVTSSQTFAATFDGQQFVELNHGGYHDGERYEHDRHGEHYDGDGCYENGDGYGHRGEGRHRGGYRE